MATPCSVENDGVSQDIKILSQWEPDFLHLYSVSIAG
jgi:hypothetical protein